MAIRKRGDSWQIDYIDPDGKRVRKSFKTRKEAKLELAARISAMDNDTYREKSLKCDTTLKQMIDGDYKDNFGGQSSYSEKRTYLSQFADWIRERKGLDPLLSDMESLTDPESDEPLLKQVHGPMSSTGVPNLILEWRDGYVTSPYLTRGAPVSPVQEERTGCHRSNGLLAAYGPKIRRSMQIHDAAIHHVKCMILEVLGIAVEESTEEPLREVLE